MNNINALISDKLKLSLKQIDNVINLLNDGCTVPFISRYRKELSNNLDEIAIQSIKDEYLSISDLVKRKDYILSVINESGKLDKQLKERIDNCWDPITLEDIYLPYKPKRRTRAEIARNNGLEPLAKTIFSQLDWIKVDKEARKFYNDNVNSVEDAINGACDIIAEWISENETARNIVRDVFYRSANIVSKVVKGKEDEGSKYSSYFDFSEPLKKAASHRILALRRAESDGILKVSISADDDIAIKRLQGYFIRRNNVSSTLVDKALKDSYRRLIKSSIENEFASSSKEKADDVAINTFSENLRQLLLSAPLGDGKRVLAIDPGFRTGCKVVCLDESGAFLHYDTIFPNAPQNDIKNASRKIVQLVEAYKIDAISLGNGTASRETESFLQKLSFSRKVQVFITNESGASIYSASKVARDEFPDKDVTVRGAISIGRRLLDPLAELVKIDPKSIGVGQYQYDVDQSKLKKSLDFVVETCVNSVGVNLNTASVQLLTSVSGLGSQLAQNIVNYRTENGCFKNRADLLNVPRMGTKSYQQSAGFLRIPNSENVLDNTAVHPECYNLVELIAKDNNCTIADLVSNPEIRNNIDKTKYRNEEVGMYTLNDIFEELEKPGRDPRKVVKVLQFDENVRDINDLREGMILNGIVTNITQFGAFVDIGIKENGLIHISEICDSFLSSPADVLKLNQHLRVRVINIDLNRRRIALSLKNVDL